ncbi:MAG: type I DNA topoisomerase, partial [Clostridia bacterium]|nr:type I DNA topoisomerase [Clostridia bacterium]
DTISKYLGSEYEVIATKGHVRDLPQKSLGVNVLDKFKPQYEVIKDKTSVVKFLKDKSAKADKIYLATDPDREGEAISWHLAQLLELNENEPIRIVFNEISKNAVTNALKNPRGIDANLVDAQQARRVLDRLVGYKISPIICKKIAPNLSAGRVQSATLKIVVDRERHIRDFKEEEYWNLNAMLYPNEESEAFKSALVKFKGKKIDIPNKESMDKVLEELDQGKYIVKELKKSTAKSHPGAPYTTSTMQQDALNKLGMNLKKVTACAQELYEGVNIEGEGKIALVTYIRTDSVRISPEAVTMARNFISTNFGEKYLPKSPNVYKTKSSAQDAHEAIRPINLDRTPERLKPHLSSDNYKLYKLIYNRFLACQMADALFDSVVANIENGEYEFKASGKTPVFDGFMKLYESGKKAKKDESEEQEEGLNAKLPQMTEGQELKVSELLPAQKFTKPLPRYTEATLVKEMEDKGIGRPATYTPTVTLLSSRKYLEKDGKALKPTELGEKVNEFMESFFEKIVDAKFTAGMETQL